MARAHTLYPCRSEELSPTLPFRPKARVGNDIGDGCERVLAQTLFHTGGSSRYEHKLHHLRGECGLAVPTCTSSFKLELQRVGLLEQDTVTVTHLRKKCLGREFNHEAPSRDAFGCSTYRRIPSYF